MSFCIQELLSSGVNSSKEKICSGFGLELLAQDGLGKVLGESNRVSRERFFSARVCLWLFLNQVLSKDKSCRAAVSRFAAYLSAQGKKSCSTLNSSYCRARSHLCESTLAQLVRTTGQELEKHSKAWHWKGRPVKMVDGCTVTMADTKANQKEYPQIPQQKPGLGFPIIRLCAVLSLASGAVLDLAMGPYSGKGTGETSLFRSLFNNLNKGDVILGDRYFCSYWIIALLMQLEIDCVFRLHQLRQNKKRFRLSQGDWLIQWQKPDRASWLEKALYKLIIPNLKLRLVRINVSHRGYRTQRLWVVTTLLDNKQFSRQDIAELYGYRWQIELDIRNIKQSIQMDFIRCKSPEMVRKEVWIHLLAYNLIRKIMAQAAERKLIKPREISFTATVQLIGAFNSMFLLIDVEKIETLYEKMLVTIATHHLPKRPGRSEPRKLKRTKDHYPVMKLPRHNLNKAA